MKRRTDGRSRFAETIAHVTSAGVTVLLLASGCGRSSPEGGAAHARSALPPSGRERVDAYAKTCALVASCAHGHDSPEWRDPEGCVDELFSGPGPASLHACLTRARTCADVAACMHGTTSARAAEYCRAHPGAEEACEGSRLHVCSLDDPVESQTVDCAAFGATCGETKAAGGLIVRGCLAPKLCPRPESFSRCDDPHTLVSCHEGFAELTRCQPDETCVIHRDNDEEAAECVRTSALEGGSGVGSAGGEPCGEPGTSACEGSRLVQCIAHGHFGTRKSLDCADLGLGCESHGGRGRCTLRERDRESRCPGGGRTVCEGGTLVFCAAGRREKVACTDLGLGACDPSARGPSALCLEK